jgi:flotillin
MFSNPLVVGAIVVVVLLLVPVIIGSILTTVDAGTIKLVTYLRGTTAIYKGPGKAIVIPVFATSTTIPSKAINIDLDIADQTADVDKNGVPKPIKVRVLASAIVSVGDTEAMITTAANKFFSRPADDQQAILVDLLTSTGRRAINLLNHDELFSAKTRPDGTIDTSQQGDALISSGNLEEDDRLAIIIKSACSRELQDLGLVFNSLNIKEVQSEVAEARRRQSAVEAKANADIVAADQERRAKEAQLIAEQAVNDKQRDLEQRRAENAAEVARAEAKRQEALATQREAELKATQIAQANADAARARIAAEPAAEAEAVKIRALGAAQADAIRAVNEAIKQGGDAYLSLKQLELLPQITPAIAQALAQAKLININSGAGAADGKGAAGGATDQITGVIQTLLATRLIGEQVGFSNGNGTAGTNGDGENAPRFEIPAGSRRS